VAETAVVEVQMPQMGESVTEGTILEWHVSEGQEVAEGDTVVEVSTDKIDAEVPAPASGVVTKILVAPDDTVEVGQVLARIDPNGSASGNGASADPSPLERPDGLIAGSGEGDADLGDESAGSDAAQPGEISTAAPGGGAEERGDADPAASGDAAEEAGATLLIPMPEMGESVTEGTVLEWHVSEGDRVAEGDTVVEVSTDKIDAEVPAPAGGVISKLLVAPDETVQVGQSLAEMVAGATSEAVAARADGDGTAPAPTPEPGGLAASPVARRVAAAKGVDLGTVSGSGAGGKIVKADVIAAADGKAPAAATEGEAKPLRGPAAMLAQAMNESRSVPTATSFRTLPVDTLDAKRKALNAELKERGMKVSFTHLIAWAIVRATVEWPVMARSYEERAGKPQVLDLGHVNLGIAVDVERKDGSRSRMVPCVRRPKRSTSPAFTPATRT
jgi:2-oxoglutarate dehydrogenase E1 component